MRTTRDGRYRGAEILDEPGIDPAVIRQAMSDVMLANRLFGGAAAVAAELRTVVPSLPRKATLLDVGTGMGDIPALAHRIAAEHDVNLRTIGFDIDETLVHAAAHRVTHVVRGDAGRLPFADKSVDVVVCSQMLHHFFDADVPRVLRELDRVARVRVVVADLRPSRMALTLFRAAATVLGFHPVSRHDGLVSIGRGFTTSDLQASIVEALGHGAYIRSRPGWRVTATWTPVATVQVTMASAA